MQRQALLPFVITGVVSIVTLATAASPNSTATGGGHYFSSGLGVDVQFAFGAVLQNNGTASGSFHHQTTLEGLAVDFHGSVTCLTFDAAHHRAWIGGVVTANASAHPAFTTAVHQVGHDIWFRVVDNGPGQSDDAPDRTTFVGFEGIIPSSQDYCDTQPWPAGDARTWPVTGNVTVNARELPLRLPELMWRRAELPAERTGEVALIGEAGLRR